MAPRKIQGKGKAGRAADEVEGLGWKESKCSDFHFLGLVQEDLLQPWEKVFWWKSMGEPFHLEGGNESVIFHSHVLCGLGIPTSNFFRGLLHHWGIQVHHLTPNSIHHICIFVNLCEAFLGIEPHFDLF